jgi:hypothetical protein
MPGKKLWATLAAVVLLIVALPAAASATTIVTTSHGTWTASPGQSTIYQASVQQPVNADGSSNFKANGKTVIPIKFGLASGTGAFVFESIFSDNPSVTNNDASFLTWTSNAPLTFADIAELSAVYAFADGDCAGGSLRWTVRLNDGGTNRNLDIHYQPGADGIGQQTCAAGTSGQNLIESADTIYVIQEFNLTHPGAFDSAYNTTYDDAVDELGSLPVVRASLIVDSGWGANGDQVVNLSSATVAAGGSSSYSETFTPQPASAVTSTCPTDPASITISKVDGAPTGDVNEPLTIQPQDNNGYFRIVDCKYMYNLATSSLSGVGTYTVKATIGSTTFTVGSFDLK